MDEAPRDERARLASLVACAVMDTPREAAFDNIVFTLAQLFRVPIALLTLVGETRVWAKALVGPISPEWVRSETFCQFIVESETILIVEDAAADPRFAVLSGVRDEPYVRFMAGAPVLGPDRHVIGTLCAIDRLPRTVTDRQRANLLTLAAQAGELLRLRVPDLDVSI